MIARVEHFSVAYAGRRGVVQALRNISLNIKAHEKIGIVGESGSGKTTLGLALAGLLSERTAMCSGVIERSGRAAMIFQDPTHALDPLCNIEQHCMEMMDLYYPQWSNEQKQQWARDCLGEVLLSYADVKHKYPHQLSGGMCQRISMALALLTKPQLCVADEPTTALDVLTQAEIGRLLTAMTAQHPMGMVIISHDIALISQWVDRIVVLHLGEIVDDQHSYARQLFSVARAMQEEPHAHAKLQQKEPVMVVKDLCCSGKMGFFQKEQAILQNVSLTLHHKEALGVLGASGSGKSTLLRCLLGLREAAGQIFYKQKNILTLSEKEKRLLLLDVQPIFQNPRQSFDAKRTVWQTLFDVAGPGHDEEIVACARDMQLTAEMIRRYPWELSGGQCQRASLVRTLLLKPSILLADEPTAALDSVLCWELLQLLRKLQEERGFAMVFVSHDWHAVRQVCGRMLVLDEGRVVTGSAHEDLLQKMKDAVPRLES